MNLYFVTRWGNDEEGPDEKDTNFVVIADDYKKAASVVDENLGKVEYSNAAKFCQRITELGVANGENSRTKIIFGPAVEYALHIDEVNIPGDKKWVRDSLEDGWVEFSKYYDD